MWLALTLLLLRITYPERNANVLDNRRSFDARESFRSLENVPVQQPHVQVCAGGEGHIPARQHDRERNTSARTHKNTQGARAAPWNKQRLATSLQMKRDVLEPLAVTHVRLISTTATTPSQQWEEMEAEEKITETSATRHLSRLLLGSHPLELCEQAHADRIPTHDVMRGGTDNQILLYSDGQHNTEDTPSSTLRGYFIRWSLRLGRRRLGLGRAIRQLCAVVSVRE
jgi:hypothetical protein